MLGFITAQIALDYLKAKASSFVYVDGKGDVSSSSKIAAILADRGNEPSAMVFTQTVQVTVAAKNDNQEALAQWPVDEKDDWKAFFQSKLDGDDFDIHSVNKLEHSEQGFSFNIEVDPAKELVELVGQLNQAFPDVTITMEYLGPAATKNTFNPLLAGSKDSIEDLSNRILALMPKS